MKIDVHIEELILEGIAPHDREVVGAAVQRELGRLFNERGVPQAVRSGGYVPRVDAGDVNFAHEARPHQMGAQIARAIYRGMGSGS